MKICKVCGGSYKRITASHLDKHNMTVDEYLQKYEIEEYRERNIVEFLLEHYVVKYANIYKFIYYTNPTRKKEGTITTIFVGKSKNRKYQLGRGDLRNHIKGKGAIGVYPKFATITDLIAFDLDSKDGDCLEVLEKLVDKLYSYNVKEENILCSYSGSKGYHVDIFLEESIDIDTAKKFQEMLKIDTLRNSNSKVVIEFRGTNRQGYKLPLGYHYKTGNRCYLCNQHGLEIDDSECLTKKRLNVNVIKEAVDINYEHTVIIDPVINDVKVLDIHIAENENRRKKIEDLLLGDTSDTIITKSYIKTNVKNSSRSFLIYEVTLYLKLVLNQTEEQALAILEFWVKNRWDKSLVDKECMDHIKSNVKSVYNGRGKYFDNATKDFYISEKHIKEVLSIDVKHKQKNLALRKLYFILMIQSYYFADSKNGNFHMAYSIMEKMGAIKNNRSVLKKQLEELQSLGKIEIVSNSVKKSVYEKDKVYESNIYSLTKTVRDDDATNVKKIKHCKGKYNCKDCMLISICTLLDRRHTTSLISLKEYKELKDSCPYKNKV